MVAKGCDTAGISQPEAAAHALKAIFHDKLPGFSLILPDKTSTGGRKWTLYELWPATVSFETLVHLPVEQVE